jgi:hypothetical protein
MAAGQRPDGCRPGFRLPFLVSVTIHFFLYRLRKMTLCALFWIDSTTTM